MEHEIKYENFLLEIKEGVAIFTINRPEVRNALNPQCFIELQKFMDWVEERIDVQVVIITGQGDKAFAAGADIKSLQLKTGVENLKTASFPALTKIESSSKPVIAAINGLAFGGGFELALACDIRIISSKAKLGLPETNLGMMPGAGGTQRLSRIIGLGRTKEIILGGKVLEGDECVNSGLAMKCVEPQHLIEEALSLANTICKKAPLSLSLSKKIINASMYTDLSTGLFLEQLGFSVLLDSKDKMEGTSAFLEKRNPTFKGK